jgi:hypothetical protein
MHGKSSKNVTQKPRRRAGCAAGALSRCGSLLVVHAGNFMPQVSHHPSRRSRMLRTKLQ